MPQRLSREQFQTLLRREQHIAHELEESLINFGASRDASKILRQVVDSLRGAFLLVVVGEYSSGKSTCINALLRADLLETGNLPTTRQVTIISQGEGREPYDHDDGTRQMYSSAPFLENMWIVDTPGTNVIIPGHERLTEDFMPRSDFIIFVIRADHAFAETEFSFLQNILSYGKKVVIVLNKIDRVSSYELNEAIEFVRENCKALLGISPEIFPVSALQAHQAYTSSGTNAAMNALELWEKSRLNPLKDYILYTLDNSERLRLKLLNPLGIMQWLLNQTDPVVDQRSESLIEYMQIINKIKEQLVLYREQMEQDYAHCLTEIENVILEMGRRGNSFIDRTIRLGNIVELFKKKQIRASFEREVIGESLKQIGQKQQELRNRFQTNENRVLRDIQAALETLRARERSLFGLIEAEHKFRQEVLAALDQLSTQSIQRSSDIIYSVSQQLDSNRDIYFQLARGAADDIAKVKEFLDIVLKHSKEMQDKTTGTAVTSAGGIGLSVAAAALIGAVGFEATAIFTVALLGWGIYGITSKRDRAKQDFDHKIQEWQANRSNPMRAMFYTELNKTTDQIQHIIERYTSNVAFERERTTTMKHQVAQLNNELHKLQQEIDQISESSGPSH